MGSARRKLGLFLARAEPFIIVFLMLVAMAIRYLSSVFPENFSHRFFGSFDPFIGLFPCARAVTKVLHDPSASGLAYSVVFALFGFCFVAAIAKDHARLKTGTHPGLASHWRSFILSS